MGKKKFRDYDFLIDSKFNRLLLKIGEKIYDNLEKLYIIPILLFVFSLGLIGYKLLVGFNVDYTISGGIKITMDKAVNLSQFNLNLKKEGDTYYLIINNNQKNLLPKIKEYLNKSNINYNIEEVSPIIGNNWESFLKRFFLILLFSFILVFLSLWAIFKKVEVALIGSRALLFNLTITFAITNLFVPLSKYILPAYLMIIGYGIDTNIILINSMLKEKKFELKKRYALAFNTGIMIHITTLLALLAGILLSNNYVFTVIFSVLFLALVVYLVDTWILNGYLLKKFMQKQVNY
jgi:preprotein translocase subunit SecF